MKTNPCILPRELADALQAEGCQLIDVREPVEFAQSHVSGAKLIPLGQIEARCSELDKTKPLFVMCQAGKRGAAAADKLSALGFSNVRNLEGGILGWKASGLSCSSGSKIVMPLMRQVQIAIGFFVLLGSLLAQEPPSFFTCCDRRFSRLLQTLSQSSVMLGSAMKQMAVSPSRRRPTMPASTSD